MQRAGWSTLPQYPFPTRDPRAQGIRAMHPPKSLRCAPRGQYWLSVPLVQTGAQAEALAPQRDFDPRPPAPQAPKSRAPAPSTDALNGAARPDLQRASADAKITTPPSPPKISAGATPAKAHASSAARSQPPIPPISDAATMRHTKRLSLAHDTAAQRCARCHAYARHTNALAGSAPLGAQHSHDSPTHPVLPSDTASRVPPPTPRRPRDHAHAPRDYAHAPKRLCRCRIRLPILP